MKVDQIAPSENLESKKVMETKKKIKDSFITLYADNPIEKISIKSITDLAGLNRGTFYMYYLDIYDLLEQIEDDLIVFLWEKLQVIISSMFNEKSVMEIFPDITFFEENKIYLKVLIGTYGKSQMTEKVKNRAKELLRETLDLKSEQEPSMLEYSLEYIATAHLGVLTYWIKNNMDLSKEQIVSLLTGAALKGPITYLLALSKV